MVSLRKMRVGVTLPWAGVTVDRRMGNVRVMLDQNYSQCSQWCRRYVDIWNVRRTS